MYSYEEFKKELKYYDLSKKEIFYIIGVFFEKTDGFTRSHKEEFFNLIDDYIVCVEWSIASYGWNYKIYNLEER